MTNDEALSLVLDDSRHKPMFFIEALTRRLLVHPDGRSILAGAMRDLAERDLQEAEALEAETLTSAEIIHLNPST